MVGVASQALVEYLNLAADQDGPDTCLREMTTLTDHLPMIGAVRAKDH
tara:strand:+ start:695 stop:838 length:144 start_codon:yes stop_codon:yes gene_type:complete